MNCDGLAMEVPSLLPACILLAFFLLFGQCCGPAEIGQKYILNSTVNVQRDQSVEGTIDGWTVFYRSGRNGNEENIYPDLYVGTRTQLTIVSVSINDASGAFHHVVNVVPVYNCTLPIYKRARTPTCEKVELEGNYLKTTCTTTEVFPQATCQFTLENGEMDRKNITDETSYITYTHTDPQQRGNEYNSTSCTLQYPVNELKPGNWTVQVTMYPDLTGVSLAQGTMGQPEIYFLSNSLTDKPEKKDSLPLGAVVGGAVGAVVVIAVVVVGVIFYIRRRREQKEARSSVRDAYDNLEHDQTTANIDNSNPYNPYETGNNPYDEIDQQEQKKEQKQFATKSKTQATTEASEGPPQYSVSYYNVVDFSEQ